MKLLDLTVGDDTNDRAKLLDALQLGINVLASAFTVLLGVLGKGLLLGSVPVLV
jgi:hypothetical protein